MSTINKIDYINYTGGRGLSEALWHDCPRGIAGVDNNSVIFTMDDFVNFSQHISAQNTQQYASYIDTGVTITQTAALGGILTVAGNDADNDEGSITDGGNTGAYCSITDTAGSEKALWFEARIKKASVADNGLAFFVGMAEEGLAAANTLVDNTGEVASKDLIGFQTLHADGDALVFCYRKAGQAKQTISLDTSYSALTADTYVKVGFKYDPSASDSKKIKLYVNGVEQSNYGTATNIAASTFPDGEALCRLLATKVGSAAEVKFNMDWWAVGFEV